MCVITYTKYSLLWHELPKLACMVRMYDTNGCDIVVICVCWLKLVGSETITNLNRHKAVNSSKVAKQSPGKPIGT